MKHLVVPAALIAVLASLAVGAPAADPINIQIGKKAALIDGGQAVEIEVEIACPGGLNVLEAFAYVVQDGNESDFAGIPLVCDGDSTKYVVRPSVFPDNPLFRTGKARVTAVVILEDPATGAIQSAETSSKVKIRG